MATDALSNEQKLQKLENLIKEILVTVGEDPEREGLKNTPNRVARFYQEFFEYEPGKIETRFETDIEDTMNQMVVIGPMRVWSLCEHHMLPFYADIIVGYIPNEYTLGLSKFARIAHKYSHRLQVQERLVQDIATEIIGVTYTKDVAVSAYGEHLCMTMRGIQTPSKMVSSAVFGAFRESGPARQEFFDISSSILIKTP